MPPREAFGFYSSKKSENASQKIDPFVISSGAPVSRFFHFRFLVPYLGILFASVLLKAMQKTLSLLITLLVLTVSVSSCEVVGGIFKAGVWTGFIVIVLVVALILWLVSRGRNRG